VTSGLSERVTGAPARSTTPASAPEEQRRCLVCAGSRARLLFAGSEERFGLGGSFPVVACERCGFAWTALALEFDLNAWYERAYWQDGEAPSPAPGRGGARWPRALRDLWRAANGSARPSRWARNGLVLDVGCGPGYDTREMQEMGARAIGIDNSGAGLRQAAGARLPLVRAAPPAYPFAAGRFDTVVMSQVLEHLPSPAQALAGAHRVLRSGGRLLVLVPNRASAQRSIFGQSWSGWHLPYHLWHFDEAALITLVRRAGFRVRRARTYSPGEWFLLSTGLRWPKVRRLGATRSRSRALRLLAAPALRLVDALGRGDCLLVEAEKP